MIIPMFQPPDATYSKVKYFANILFRDQVRRLVADKLDCATNLVNAQTTVIPGKKYYKVNIGGSGRYMVEISTGIIYGIRAYGKINPIRTYGTLDTAEKYNWGNYQAIPVEGGAR